MIKVVYNKPTANIIFNHGKNSGFLQKSGIIPLLPALLSDLVLQILVTAFSQEKEVKAIQIRREELNLSLYVDVMILYKDNSNFSTKKILRINKFTQVAGYTINIKKCIAFFYTLIMNYQKETKKTIHFLDCMKIA